MGIPKDNDVAADVVGNGDCDRLLIVLTVGAA
jgi:hypothetical protein